MAKTLERQKAFYNNDSDKIARTPGWSLEALKFLHEKRNVKAIVHETLDTDSGIDFANNKDLICERYWLLVDKFQIEVLNKLTQLPPTGAAIFIGAPNI